MFALQSIFLRLAWRSPTNHRLSPETAIGPAQAVPLAEVFSTIGHRAVVTLPLKRCMVPVLETSRSNISFSPPGFAPSASLRCSMSPRVDGKAAQRYLAQMHQTWKRCSVCLSLFR